MSTAGDGPSASSSSAAGTGDVAPPSLEMAPSQTATHRSVNAPRLLYFYFASNYFAQGVFQSFIAFEQPFLESYGLSLTEVGLAQSLSQLPWVLKIVFAVPSDTFNCFGLGFRRPYALLGLGIGALFLFVLSSFDPGSAFALYIIVSILRNTGVCIADVATDGLAVDSGLEEQSGIINSFMTAGRMLGLVLASQLAGVVATASGFTPMIWMLSAFVLAVVWVPLLLREERAAGVHNFEWKALRRNFSSCRVALFLAAACASNGGLAVANFPLAKWQREKFNFSLQQVGTGAAVASLGLLLGSVANGPLFDRVNKRLAMLVAGAASTAALFSYAAAFNEPSVYAARFFSGVAEGAVWIVQAGLTMRLADKRCGSSFFALAIMVRPHIQSHAA